MAKDVVSQGFLFFPLLSGDFGYNQVVDSPEELGSLEDSLKEERLSLKAEFAKLIRKENLLDASHFQYMFLSTFSAYHQVLNQVFKVFQSTEHGLLTKSYLLSKSKHLRSKGGGSTLL
uniref:Uncharacterized protein n=1 Tax=Cucumis sativus TaxID=3659 RepID=A0A0A0K3X2_CUCSA